MKRIKALLLRCLFVLVMTGALSIVNPIPFVCDLAETEAKAAASSIEEYRDKYIKKLLKVYKHYNKALYSKKAYKTLTAYYEEGVNAISECDETAAVRNTYADYREKLYSVRPSKLVKYQQKLEKRLLDAYDSLISEKEYSERGLANMEDIRDKGLEKIFAAKNKRRSRNELNAVIDELTSFSDSPEANRDVIAELEATRKRLTDNADYYNSLDDTSKDTWCFKRMNDHLPSESYEFFKISDYDGFYLNKNVTDDDKVIYLTFDCGYPSNLTEKILDTLAKHNAKASFFVTKMYLEECGDYARRMVEEGHDVCNHTVNHADLRNKSVEKIASEIIDVAEYFYEITGTEFAPFFRTPTGAYTKRLLTIIKDAGYKTVFWSIAYGDYDTKNQPAPGYVTNHFKTYHHNGAIALMHNDSTSNANELDAVLTLLEKEGYRFGLLSEIQ